VGRVYVLLAIVAAALGGATAAGGDLPELAGTVGPEFKIDVADASGKHVDEVTPGDYVRLVHDRSESTTSSSGGKSTGERLANDGGVRREIRRSRSTSSSASTATRAHRTSR
jgi:hypothetical protein